jgi:2-(1,2-epoxy-1,2-dihydrophenyl)acetyl-CoA isomerase
VADPLLVDRTDRVVTVTLNRPESLNALNVALKEALRDTLGQLAADSDCRALLLTGAGRAFCVGQDLREHAAALEAGAVGPLATVREHFNPIAQRLGDFPKPVVAAVNGAAAGAGASLALLADFRVAGPGTSFLMAFANVGLAGDTGVSWSLPRLVGRAAAAELLMLAEPVDVVGARELGLVSRVVDDDAAILPTAMELAQRLAAGPTVAYGQIKRELAAAASGTLAQALDVEAQAQALCGATDDHRHATAAFVAKRAPTFTGR